jgi:hypothetical protein
MCEFSPASACPFSRPNTRNRSDFLIFIAAIIKNKSRRLSKLKQRLVI